MIDLEVSLDRALGKESEITDVECILKLIDSSHSIIIDKNIGITGEYKNNKIKHKTSNKLLYLKYMYRNDSLNEKRGDIFTVIGKTGAILIKEKVEYTFIFEKNGIKDNTKYAFILYNVYTDDNNSTVVVYNPKDETFRTNHKKLEYDYDSKLILEKVNSISYVLNDNGKKFWSEIINRQNNIGVFSAHSYS